MWRQLQHTRAIPENRGNPKRTQMFNQTYYLILGVEVDQVDGGQKADGQNAARGHCPKAFV